MSVIQLSIVIPAYNEEGSIAQTVSDLAKALDTAQISFEIICANNCSKDKTAAIITELTAQDPRIILVNTPALQGYGIAVRTGLHHVKGEAVVICMADGCDKPEDVIAYYRALTSGTYDCAFGSRFMVAGSIKGYPELKMHLNRAGNFLLRLMTGAKYDDFTNGFKCYRTDFLRSIGPFVCNQFNLTIEMSLKAVMAGGRYIVVPNSWEERAEGVSKFAVIRQSILYLITIFYLLLDRTLKQKAYETMRRNNITF